MGAKRIEVDPETQKHARYLYEYTDAPVSDIAEVLGMSRGTTFLRIKEWGWTRRLQVAPRMPRRPPLALAASASTPQTRTAADAQGETPAEADASSTVEQLARTVERELEAIDKVLAGLPPGEERPAQAERVARTLASLTRTLNEIRRMRHPAPAFTQDPDGPAVVAALEKYDDLSRDIDEFRRALARRIDAFVASRADASLPRSGE
jgi:hypothetical protein